MTWYHKGAEGIERGKKKEAEDKARMESRVPFKLKVQTGETHKVTLLDDPDFFFDVHSLKNSRGFFDDVTCIHATENCPVCESGKYASYVLACTVIDHTGYVDKKDQVRHKHIKRIAFFKKVAKERILRRKSEAEGQNLKLCCFSFSRDGEKECITGEEITFLKKFTLKELLKIVPKEIQEKGKEEIKKWLTPFDLAKIYKPKSAEELRALVGGSTPVGAGNDNLSDDDLFGEDAKKEESVDDLFSDDTKTEKSDDKGLIDDLV